MWIQTNKTTDDDCEWALLPTIRHHAKYRVTGGQIGGKTIGDIGCDIMSTLMRHISKWFFGGEYLRDKTEDPEKYVWHKFDYKRSIDQGDIPWLPVSFMTHGTEWAPGPITEFQKLWDSPMRDMKDFYDNCNWPTMDTIETYCDNPGTILFLHIINDKIIHGVWQGWENRMQKDYPDAPKDHAPLGWNDLGNRNHTAKVTTNENGETEKQTIFTVAHNKHERRIMEHVAHGLHTILQTSQVPIESEQGKLPELLKCRCPPHKLHPILDPTRTNPKHLNFNIHYNCHNCNRAILNTRWTRKHELQFLMHHYLEDLTTFEVLNYNLMIYKMMFAAIQVDLTKPQRQSFQRMLVDLDRTGDQQGLRNPSDTKERRRYYLEGLDDNKTITQTFRQYGWNAKGKGNSDPIKGQSSKGKGSSDKGNEQFDPNKGKSSKGKGPSYKGQAQPIPDKGKGKPQDPDTSQDDANNPWAGLWQNPAGFAKGAPGYGPTAWHQQAAWDAWHGKGKSGNQAVPYFPNQKWSKGGWDQHHGKGQSSQAQWQEQNQQWRERTNWDSTPYGAKERSDSQDSRSTTSNKEMRKGG